MGFGTLKKVHRKTRKGRNPQTGKQIKIKGRNIVTFKAGKALKEKIYILRSSNRKTGLFIT